MPHLSVVVPAYNRQDTIENCLAAVRKSIWQDYELIVVDGGSRDATRSIARGYADMVITLRGKKERSHVRDSGFKAAKGEIVVNIDSDIAIKPDTLSRIADYFSKHQKIHALNGLLSKEHPNPDFLSQYKNLYMNYVFNILPESVTFLYGSIHALRRQAAQPYSSDIKIADDTALGQKLVSLGKKIAFLKDLEVVHLKKYNLRSFIKNDFRIPFDWAKIFLKYKGWNELGRNKTRFAHSPKEQIISVTLAPIIFASMIAVFFGYPSFLLSVTLFLVWFFLNRGFLAFLGREKGFFFATLAIFVTFADNLIMALGIFCGFSAFFVKAISRANGRWGKR